MSQYSQPPQPPMPPGYGTPPPGYGPPMPPAYFPPQHHVVHITAKRSGFMRVVGMMFAVFAFAAVFVGGIIFGVVSMSMGPEIDSALFSQVYRDGSKNRIAILPIEGAINGHAANFVRAATKKILEDSSIRAVVLRVDSPGGEVAASDQIWNEVERLKTAGIPVIASYGGYAASGGYYVSCGADFIVAEPTCITGSIGVIAQIMTLDGLMHKVGIEPVTLVASGSPEKNVANDMFRSWNERDRERIVQMLDAAYDRFSSRVRLGRRTAIADEAKLASIANGSIYTAQQALDNGLVDSIGYLDDAIAQAESAAKLTKGAGKVVVLRLPTPLFGGGLFGDAGARAAKGVDWFDADRIRGFANELASPRVMYMMH